MRPRMRDLPGAICDLDARPVRNRTGGYGPRHPFRGQTKKPARRLAFSWPKAGEELLLRGFLGSGGRSSSGSGGRSSSSGGSRSGSSSGSRSGSSGSGRGSSSGSGRSGSSSSGFSGLRSFSSRLRCFNLGRFGGLRGFGLATSRYSQGEEGSYEERLLHMSKILNVMEIRGQLVDRNVSISINRGSYHDGEHEWCGTASAWPGFCLTGRLSWSANRGVTAPTIPQSAAARD